MSSIEWTDVTWNPVIGCAKVSAGCKNCYAERSAHRVASMQGGGVYLQVLRTETDERGYIEQVDPRWNGRAVFLPERLGEPLHWRKPCRVFVNSMSDLFHEDITFGQISAVFGVMAATPHLTYQVLTKRAARMLEFFAWLTEVAADEFCGSRVDLVLSSAATHVNGDAWDRNLDRAGLAVEGGVWPLPNVHLGVSVEDQAAADERIPLLLQCPAALRFLSVEPLLGPVDLDLAGGDCPACDGEAVPRETISEHGAGCAYASHDILDDGGGRCTTCGKDLRPCGVCGPYHGRRAPRDIGWMIVGGESGPGARPFQVEWARSLRDQCRAAGVPIFIKQLGGHVLDRNDAGYDGMAEDEWPVDTKTEDHTRSQGELVRIRLQHSKGADKGEWPEDLRVQEFPR